MGVLESMTGQLLKTFMEPLGIDRIRTSQCTSTLDTRVYEYTAVLIKNGFLCVSNVRKFEIKVCLLQLTTEYLQCGNRTHHCSFQMEESGLERRHGEQEYLLCKHSNLSLYLQDPCTKQPVDPVLGKECSQKDCHSFLTTRPAPISVRNFVSKE